MATAMEGNFEYGDTVAFLASTNASYITGSVIRIDGGQVPSI
jgi:3-oxoacyl-[acyl-carrier protein] reductase